MGMENVHEAGRAGLICAFLGVLAAVAFSDIKTRKIPDAFVMTLGIIGLCAILLFPEIGLSERFGGVLSVSFALLVITFIVPGSFGGGDIKLMAVCGGILGWRKSFLSFAVAIFLCGIYCVTMITAKKMKRKSQLPFGPFLCAGMTIVIFWGEAISEWFELNF